MRQTVTVSMGSEANKAQISSPLNGAINEELTVPTHAPRKPQRRTEATCGILHGALIIGATKRSKAPQLFFCDASCAFTAFRRA